MMQALDRGEVWLVDMDYAAKTWPALVLSLPFLDQDRAIVTLVPHTTSLRGSRFEVSIEKRFLGPGAFDVQNLLTIPHVNLLRRLDNLTAHELATIEDCVRMWLGL
jgi:mRNA interferase MazF